MFMKNNAPIYLLSCAALLALEAPLAAQEAIPNNPSAGSTASDITAADMNDIIVTAQRRSERLSSVPISITAASGDQLLKRGITTPDQLDQIAPGFTYQKAAFGTPVFTIRGVGFFDTSIGGSPAVSLYVDQVPLPYSIMTRGVSLDLERVEVLKGPQGTLFGQSSTGGAVNYIAAKPTEKTQSGFSLNIGRFNTVASEAFISGRITENVTARIAGRYEYGDGWQRPDLRNDARFGKSPSDRLGRRRFYTGRLLLDWTPTDRLRFEFGVNGWHDGSDTQASRFIAFRPVVPLNPANAPVYAALSPLVPTSRNPRLAGWGAGGGLKVNDDFHQLSMRADWDLDGFTTLSAITAYSRFRDRNTTDIDGTAYADFLLIRDGRINSFSQELRLSGKIDRLDWMLGGNYATDHSTENQINILGSTNANIGPFKFDSLAIRNDQRVKTYAAFGSLGYRLSSVLTLQGSARYTIQDRDFKGCLADPGNGQIATALGLAFGIPTVPGGCVTQASPGALLPIVTSALNEENFSFRTSLNWQANSDTLLYLTVSRGYKSGSYPVLPAILASQFAPVTQESVVAYEAGLKSSLLDKRLTFDGSLFYSNYRNKQILGSAVIAPFGILPKLVNIPRSRVFGVEAQATLLPFEGLRITGGAAYYNSRVQSDPDGPVDAFGSPTSFVGDELPTTPKWQIVSDAEYGVALGVGKRVFLGGSVTHRHSTYSVFGENPELLLPAYTLIDLRTGIEATNGAWRGQIWGRNVTNKLYYSSIQHGTDNVAGLAGMPATYGVTLSFRY